MTEITNNWQELYSALQPKEPLFCPEEPSLTQKIFLKTNRLEALFGGSAGGGKSSALLMAALQYVDVPDYTAILFRRTFADLALPGAVMDRLVSWISEYDEVRWNANNFVATFPSGARIAFGYLNNVNDKLRYKSAEFQFCVRSDTKILLPDGDYTPISRLREGQEVMTLDGPRQVQRVYHFGMKPSVHILTERGHIVGSDSHRIMLADGSWMDPTSLASIQDRLVRATFGGSAPLSQIPSEPQPGSHWGSGQVPSDELLSRVLGAHREIASSSRDGQTDFEAYLDELREAGQLPLLTVPVALSELHPDSVEPFDPIDYEFLDEYYWSEVLSSLADYRTSQSSYDAQLHEALVFAQARTPSLVGAGLPFQPYWHTDDLGHIPSHTRPALSQYVHPYTMEPRQLSSAAFRPAWAGMVPAGEQDLWDIQVEDSHHYLSDNGLIISNCGMDEVTEIREADYRYLFSRLRRPKAGPLSEVPLRMRAASNPAPNWVRQRFIVEGEAKGRIFVRSSLHDNPGIDQASYERSLEELDWVERQRLQHGDWWAVESGSMFKRENFEIIGSEELPALKKPKLVRFWDLAATKPSEINPDPDWTVGLLMMEEDGIFYILDVRRIRDEAHVVEKYIKDTALEDGPHVAIRMEQEPGSSGKALGDYYARHVLVGYDFAYGRETGDKQTKARPLKSASDNGNVKLVRGPWTSDFLDEITAFPEGGGHDDQVDAAAGAFNDLTGLGKKLRSKVRLIV